MAINKVHHRKHRFKEFNFQPTQKRFEEFLKEYGRELYKTNSGHSRLTHLRNPDVKVQKLYAKCKENLKQIQRKHLDLIQDTLPVGKWVRISYYSEYSHKVEVVEGRLNDLIIEHSMPIVHVRWYRCELNQIKKVEVLRGEEKEPIPYWMRQK